MSTVLTVVIRKLLLTPPILIATLVAVPALVLAVPRALTRALLPTVPAADVNGPPLML